MKSFAIGGLNGGVCATARINRLDEKDIRYLTKPLYRTKLFVDISVKKKNVSINPRTKRLSFVETELKRSYEENFFDSILSPQKETVKQRENNK